MCSMAKQINHDEMDKIRKIITEHKIVTQYQPIVSVTKKKIIGLESLARGLDLENNALISPLEIFQYAEKNGLILPLDRFCREKGIEGFLDIHALNPDLYLFINMDASVVDMVGGSNYLLRQVFKHSIPPENIVIEINESKVQNTDQLVRFVDNYRKSGFLIAIDDLGVGFSNFERISLIKPDILKFDRSLIKEIGLSYYKQEIFKCLVNLANKIGAVVVAEGVETEAELNAALEYGAHLIQGYYFLKPKFFDNDLIDNLKLKISGTASEYKNYMNSKINQERTYRLAIDKFLGSLITELKNSDLFDYDDLFLKYVKNHSDLNIECSYILDEQGIQVSGTLFSNNDRNYRQKLMFYPAVKGVDHSLKSYFYKLMNSREDKYLSKPYVSHATGNVCVTATKIFQHSAKRYILCVDFLYKV